MNTRREREIKNVMVASTRLVSVPALKLISNQYQLFSRYLSKIAFAHRVQRERCQLSGLTDVQLRDIGINRADAELESSRFFLDIPPKRRIELGELDSCAGSTKIC